MEQVDEITTSTATSTNGAAYTSQAVQVRSTVNNGLEEVEETNDRDLPPLTGKKCSNEYKLILSFINNNPSKNWKGGFLQK